MKVKDIIKGIDEAKQRLAVKKALVGFLRTRYLSRDGLDPQAFISYERSTVTEDVILEITNELEREIASEEANITATLEEGVDNG